MSPMAMILLEDAIRVADRNGYVAVREGNRLVVYPKDDFGSASTLLDLSEERAGIITVSRHALAKMIGEHA